MKLRPLDACAEQPSELHLVQWQMSNYFDFLGRNVKKSEGLWTSPYLDAWGLGLMVTHAIPCISRVDGRYAALQGIPRASLCACAFAMRKRTVLLADNGKARGRKRQTLNHKELEFARKDFSKIFLVVVEVC